MGKNKLKKFADMETFRCVLQYPRHLIPESGFPLQGNWNRDFFLSPAPLVLELGCGKGEYTVGLALRHPDRNFIGLDIKGARMWTGAKTVEEQNIPNAAFLRTEIELVDRFFAPGEVSEIWITFPDPQMQKSRKRLTSTRFLDLYRKIMGPEGVVHLKTDSPFLYEYTRRLVTENNLEVLRDTDDLYSSGLAATGNSGLADPESSGFVNPETSIKTYYEQQWLSRGKKIKLISFRLGSQPLAEPREDDIERDDYRAYPRHDGRLKEAPRQ